MRMRCASAWRLSADRSTVGEEASARRARGYRARGLARDPRGNANPDAWRYSIFVGPGPTAPSSRRVSSRTDGCDRADLDGAVVGRTIVRSARANPPIGARARVATGGVKSETAEKHAPPPRFRRDLSEGTARSRARTERMLLLKSGARGHLGREEPLAACAESVKGRTCVGVPCALERMLAPRSRRASLFFAGGWISRQKSRSDPFAVSKQTVILDPPRQHSTVGPR